MTGRLNWTIALLSCAMALAVEALPRASAEGTFAIERFMEGIEKAPVAYQATRRLEASASKLNESAWMEAFTEYSAESGFQYRVLNLGGSERIQNRALKAVLESEKQSLTEWRKAAFTRENYDFTLSSSTADGQIAVRLTPLRRDPRLIDGTAWLSARTGKLLRLEGRLAKSPSFWIKWVNVTRRYGSINGTTLPLSVESTADVRIAGLSRFSMVYDYAAVAGENLGNRFPNHEILRSGN